MDLKLWDWSRPCVRIKAGPEQVLFLVLPDALSHQSPVWEARLNGSWKDCEADIDWTEFETETIKCVVSFVYMGAYDPIYYSSHGDEDPTGRKAQPPVLCGSGITLPEADMNDLRGARKMIKVMAEDGNFNFEPCMPANLVMVHCKVYLFAAQFLCPKLKDFAMKSMYEVLRAANIETTDALAGCARALLFIHNSAGDKDSATAPARALLMDFYARHVRDPSQVGQEILGHQVILQELVRKLVERSFSAENSTQWLLAQSTL